MKSSNIKCINIPLPPAQQSSIDNTGPRPRQTKSRATKSITENRPTQKKAQTLTIFQQEYAQLPTKTRTSLGELEVAAEVVELARLISRVVNQSTKMLSHFKLKTNGDNDLSMTDKLIRCKKGASKSRDTQFDRITKIRTREVKRETLEQLAHNLEVQFSRVDQTRLKTQLVISHFTRVTSRYSRLRKGTRLAGNMMTLASTSIKMAHS